jgi:hypothetical protein
MPFKLGTQTIQLDTPFTHNDIQYPANWIRLATEEDKAAIGLVWEADPVRADDRFYWDGDINNPKALEDVIELNVDGQNILDDNGNPIITKGLKSQFIAQAKQAAGSILAQTDWMITRKVERNVDVPASTAQYRNSIVVRADELEAAIAAVATVEALIALDMSFPSK